MPTFEKIRISLDREQPGPLIEQSGFEEKFRSRREFLEDVFAEPRVFTHAISGKRFEFVPLPIEGDFLAGIFKRPRPLPAHDRTLQPYEAENYEGSVFILSLEKDQIAWVQNNRRLGSNKALLESFFAFARSSASLRDWKVYVKYLRDEQEYWAFIAKNRPRIAKLIFTFIPPNALGADGQIYELIKAVKIDANPDIQQHVYKAPPGQIDPTSEYMTASARIAMEGGGEAEAKGVDNRTLYSSTKAQKIVAEVPEGELPTEAHPSFVNRLRDWLFSK